MARAVEAVAAAEGPFVGTIGHSLGGLSAAVAAARAKMSGPVAALAAVGGPQPVDLVVRYADHPELFDAERVAELGGQVIRAYKVLDMQTIRLPADALDELALEEKSHQMLRKARIVSNK